MNFLPWRKRTVLAVGGLLAGVLASEALLHCLPWAKSAGETMRSRPAMFVNSPHLIYTLQPHFSGRHTCPEFDVAIHLNSRGYRCPEFEWKKGPQDRILCLGDSFTFGFGVEDDQSWPMQLRRQFATNPSSKPPEVINAAYQSCFYPDTYYLYLRRTGIRLSPDLVLVGFFVGNDIDHPALPTRVQDMWHAQGQDGLPTQIRGSKTWNGYYIQDQPPKTYLPLLRESRLVHQSYLALQNLRQRSRNQHLEKETDLYRSWSPRVQEKAHIVNRLLSATRDLTEVNGSRLAVVLIPEFVQFGPAKPGQDLEKPQREIKALLDEQKIPYLDLLAIFRENGGASLYFPVDQHWTAEGHKLAAQSVAQWIQAENLLGSVPQSNQVLNRP